MKLCQTCRQPCRRYRRSCCRRCYETHRGNIAAGNTTWADLEARGLVLPATRGCPDGVRRARK